LIPARLMRGKVRSIFAGSLGRSGPPGRFLGSKATRGYGGIAGRRLSLRLFVESAWTRTDELEFPPELLTACGRHSLGVYVISNDIPAAEVLAARQG